LEATNSLSAYSRLLRENPNFRLLWYAQIVSELGDGLSTVAIYSMLLQFTGSAQSVAIAYVLQVLPQFFVAPAAGVLNDRLSRKRIMIFADWARALLVLGMLLVRAPGAIWFLYVLLVLVTIMWALFEPGRNALVPIIAGPKQRMVANSLSSATWSFNLAIGSALGGVAAAIFGRDTVFVLNSLSFVASALLVSRIRVEEPHTSAAPPFRARDLADFTPILEGIRYVRRDVRTLALMLVKCGLGLMGANWVILPLLGERVFPVRLAALDPRAGGVLAMSLLMGSRGVGSLLGPLIGSLLTGPEASRLRRGILCGFLVAAAGYFALGVAPTLLLACAAVVLAHAGGSTVWVFSTTLLQAQTEDRFRGRVFSAESAFNILSTSTVSYLAGFVVDLGVAARTVALGTGALMLIPFLGGSLLQRLWRGEQAPEA
jgi:predicted MFS family arabinose efflux permease